MENLIESLFSFCIAFHIILSIDIIIFLKTRVYLVVKVNFCKCKKVEVATSKEMYF